MIEMLLNEVEKEFGHGLSANWTQHDFEKLSELIFIRSKIQLSTTTLKRLWGKAHYKSHPSIQTLNALSVFVGYEHWRDFEQTKAPNKPQEVYKTKFSKNILWPFILVSFLLTATLAYFLTESQNPKRIDKDDYEFSLSKIKTSGVPNSVIFTYDASKAPGESVYIAQSWDVKRKIKVPKNGKSHSAIYYYPGFFNAKLMVDTVVVKHQNLQITTEGWLAIIENEPSPVYLKKAEVEKANGLEVSSDLLAQYGYDARKYSPKIRFYNQRDFDQLRSDHFIFETEIRNQDISVNNPCHRAELLIQCKNEIIRVPLTDKACVGNIELVFGDIFREAKYEDLSGFGSDLTAWTKLRIESKNGLVRFFVNNKKAFELKNSSSAADIVGVQYRFLGAAEIRSCRFWNAKGTEIIL